MRFGEVVESTTGKDYFFESQLNGQKISLYGGNVIVNNNIATYDKGTIGSINNQIWYLTDAGDDYFFITSKANNLVLDIYGISQIRTQVKQCGETSQHWKFVQDGCQDIVFIENRCRPGHVMTVDPGELCGTTVNWVNLQAKQTIGNDKQEFKVLEN